MCEFFLDRDSEIGPTSVHTSCRLVPPPSAHSSGPQGAASSDNPLVKSQGTSLCLSPSCLGWVDNEIRTLISSAPLGHLLIPIVHTDRYIFPIRTLVCLPSSLLSLSLTISVPNPTCPVPTL